MEVNENIAEVFFDPETKQIVRITFCQDGLRFKCTRCGTLCCKLGGPKLTKKDAERIRHAGHDLEDFLEPAVNLEFKGSPIMLGNLKNRKDGSCIFLESSSRKGVYKCSIYDFRPALCRLYPFDFERISPNSFILKFIPCCKGLNGSDGEFVDERFITCHLLGSILEIL